MNQSQKALLPLPIWIYILGWIFFVYLFVQIILFKAEASTNILLSGLYFIEFGVHEVSHIVVSFLPAILVALAGSIGEISFTLLLFYAAHKEKSYFAAVFAGLWVMLAFNSAGRYMVDARSQLLPLVGPGDTVQHDWFFVFHQLGWLNADHIIGNTVRGVGDIIGLYSLLFGLYLICKKWATSTQDSGSSHL